MLLGSGRSGATARHCIYKACAVKHALHAVMGMIRQAVPHLRLKHYLNVFMHPAGHAKHDTLKRQCSWFMHCKAQHSQHACDSAHTARHAHTHALCGSAGSMVLICIICWSYDAPSHTQNAGGTSQQAAGLMEAPGSQ